MRILNLCALYIICILITNCSNSSSNNESKKVTGSINGNTYVGSTNVSLDANTSILFGQGSNYSYILEHVWKVLKENPEISKVDINFIITGDDGYGNKKTASWPHLIFQGYQLNELRKYTDLNKMDWSSKADILDLAGMYKLKDSKGDLDPYVFSNK